MRNSTIISGVLLALVLQAGIAAAQNLAVNPGFETGDTSGWFAFGSPTISAQTSVVHSGAYAALVSNRSQTYEGIAQSFLGVLQDGQTYTVSAWVQLQDGASQTMQVTAEQTDDSGTAYYYIASGTVSAGSWTQLTGQFTLNVSGTLTELTIYFEMPSSATSSYYLDDLSVTPPATAPTSGSCTVDWSTVFQRIDGFGASSAWRSTWNTTQANMFFSTNATGTGTSLDGKISFYYTGAGLSLLRNHIAYAGSAASSATPGTVEVSIMQMAQARGARVWSTPWTPASGFKSNNGPDGGDYLGSGNNATNLAYASQLANYVYSMEITNHVNLYALSIQNEPDANVTTYEAAVWTGNQFHDFVTNLYSALAAKGVGSTKIILPESEVWPGNPGLFTPTLSDPVAAADVSIIADHDYVSDNTTGDLTTPAQLSASDKTVWETEVSQIGDTYDGSITNALYWAGRIHLYMTAAQANAWHYWWLIAGNNDDEGLADTNGVPAKRLYALGQFSRFVRPNFYRINVPTNSTAVQISAYKDSGSANFAIVAINSSSMTVTQTFNLTNVTVSSVTPWLTSASFSITNQPAVAVADASFTYALPAMSIVTFAGQSTSNTPPVFAVISNQTINPGFTLVLTNSATDSPPQTLTYTLLAAPTNATLNTSSAVFTWRPLLTQANTTNTVTIAVTDNGTPNLNATNTFKVMVNPVVRPVVTAIQGAGGRVTIAMNGASGPDYSLLTSSNLTGSWHVLFATNSPMLPVTIVQTNTGKLPTAFYRIQIGP